MNYKDVFIVVFDGEYALGQGAREGLLLPENAVV